MLPRCPNSSCNGHQKKLPTARFKSRGKGIYYCRICKTSWHESRGTFLYNIKTPAATVLNSIYKISKGKSLRQVAKEERVSVDSIYLWLKRAKEFSTSISPLFQKYLKMGIKEIREIVTVLKK